MELSSQVAGSRDGIEIQQTPGDTGMGGEGVNGGRKAESGVVNALGKQEERGGLEAMALR